MRILPSTGAFIGRVNGRDHRAFLAVSEILDSDSFEFMMYESFYGRTEPILSDFLATGLSFPVFHVEKRVGELIGLGGEENRREAEDRFAENCRAAVRLGAEKLVFHLWNGVASDRNFAAHLESYATFASLARAHGLLLTVENVVCAVDDPLSHFAELADAYPDVAFTFDTKMAAFHRQEHLLNAPVLGGRLAHMHFNDYAGTPGDFGNLAVLHLGEGRIDLAGVARALLASGYDSTVTLECGCMRPDGSLTPEKMNASLVVARRLLATAGKE